MRPGATGIVTSGTAHAERSRVVGVEAEPIVLAAGSQRSSWTTSSTRFDERVAETPNRSVTLIDAEAAHLDVMPRQLGAGPDQDRLAAAPDLDGVVGDQPVAAADEVERALALADAALADDQDAQAEDVHQHAVRDAAGARWSSSSVVSRAIATGVASARAQQRHAGAFGFGDELGGASRPW